MFLFSCLVLTAPFGGVGRADEATAVPAGPDQPPLTRIDKAQYHLFRPTPQAYLRELTPDRPDKTESPYTVDAGHFQLEMDLVSYTHDAERAGGVARRVEAWAIAPLNLKAGLCNQADLQVIVETWNEVETKARGPGLTLQRHSHGFGNVTTRMKYNFWGNDGGPTAFGMIPFAKWPTSQDRLGNGNVEGGIVFPLAVELPRGFGMGLMTEFTCNRDDLGNGSHPEFVNSITFSHDLVGRLGGYVEFFSATSSEPDSDWVGTVDFGLTYGLTENLQLDTGVNVGVTKSADDLNLFFGLSCRY